MLSDPFRRLWPEQFPDLYLSIVGQKNELYLHNSVDNFVQDLNNAAVAFADSGQHAAVLDANGDVLPDLLTSSSLDAENSRLFISSKSSNFVRETRGVAVNQEHELFVRGAGHHSRFLDSAANSVRSTFAVALDVNNDGVQDLYVRSYLTCPT